MSSHSGDFILLITNEQMIEIKRRASMERAEAFANIGRQIGGAVKRLFKHRPAPVTAASGTRTAGNVA